MTDQALEIARRNGFAGQCPLINGFEHFSTEFAGRIRALEDHDIAVGMRFDSEAILQHGQMGVEFAQRSRQRAIVFEGNDEARVGGLRLGGALRAWHGLPAISAQIRSPEGLPPTIRTVAPTTIIVPAGSESTKRHHSPT